MMGDNVCLSFIHTERDLQNLELLPLPSPFLFFRSSFLSTLLFFKLKSHPISIPLGYYYSVRYLHTQNLLELIENGNIFNIMFAPAFFYTLAQRWEPQSKGEATQPEYTTFVCRPTIYKYKGIAYTTREGVATPTASLAAYLQLFHSHHPILHHWFFRYFRSLRLLSSFSFAILCLLGKDTCPLHADRALYLSDVRQGNIVEIKIEQKKRKRRQRAAE